MANPKEFKKIARFYRIRRAAVTIIILSLVLGLIYPALADGFNDIYPFINGILIGVLGGTIISMLEFYIFNEANKKINFISLVIIKVLTYSIVFTVLVLGIVMISRGFKYGYSSLSEMYHSKEFDHFLYNEDLTLILSYTFIFTILIIFFKEISRKLGREVLFNFITGKYYKPRKEERIFMFLDINDSTTIAENMNELEFHTFVNMFFKDISDAILFTRGKVYQYVGDEVIVSWSMLDGIKDANCVYAYLYALQSIQKESDKYKKKFGFVPSFKAALHCGNVIRGEIGDVKSEIVFHGDVMNTTSRIESLCGKVNESLLISEILVKNFPLSYRKYFNYKGSFELRGKENKVKIFCLADNTKTYLDLDQQN